MKSFNFLSFLAFNVVVAQTIKRPTFIKYCLDILYSLLRQIKMLLVHLWRYINDHLLAIMLGAFTSWRPRFFWQFLLIFSEWCFQCLFFYLIGLDFSEKCPIGVFMMDGCSWKLGLCCIRLKVDVKKKKQTKKQKTRKKKKVHHRNCLHWNEDDLIMCLWKTAYLASGEMCVKCWFLCVCVCAWICVCVWLCVRVCTDIFFL